MLSPVEDHSLQEFNTTDLDSETKKLLDHPKQKPGRGGGGGAQIKSAAKSLYRSIFLDDDILY